MQHVVDQGIRRSQEIPPPRLIIVFNPCAGGNKRRRLLRALRLLEPHFPRIMLHETLGPGEASEFVERTAEPSDLVVAAGGDGTVNDVLAGAVRFPEDLRPALGVLPLGTANVLAHEIGIGGSIAKAADALSLGRTRLVSYASVGEHPFLLMASVGFDAHVVAHVKHGLKNLTGAFAYVWETLVQALRYDFPSIRLKIDGSSFEAVTAVIGNGRLYGGAFTAIPNGDLAAPAFHAVLLKRKGYGNVLRYGIALTLGRLHRLSDVAIIPAREVEILSPASAPLQADGDDFGIAPCILRAGAGQIRLIWP